MKTIPRVLVPFLLLAPFGLAGEWRADHPRFRPEAGMRLSKTLEMQGELDLEDSTMEVDGVDRSEMFGQLEMVMRVGQSITVTDHYEQVANGRVTRLKRAFDELGGTTRISGSHPVAGPIEEELEMASELEGKIVVFTWDATDEAYVAAFADEGADEELLEDLREDLDLSGFLPSEEVAEGESWSVDAEVVRGLLAPGGDLKLRPDGPAGQFGSSSQFSQNDLIGELDGKFQATFAGVREEEGAKVAVIKLDLQAHSARDMSSLLEELAEQMQSNLPEGMEVDFTSLDGEYEFDAEGELLWDLGTGLVHGLSLSGQMRQIVDTAMTMKMGSNSSSMETSQTFAGTQTFVLTTSR